MNRIQRALERWRDAERRAIAARGSEAYPQLERRVERARRAYHLASAAAETRTADAGSKEPSTNTHKIQGGHQMRTTIDRTAIKPDSDVYASDGAHVGTVSEVGEDYILVQKGLIFVHDLFIPINAIERVEDGRVYLQVSKHDVETGGWDQPPASYEHHSDLARGNERIAVHEEELEARKTVRQAGEVQIRKDVFEEERTMDVPVTREEVTVSRHAVDRPATDAEANFSTSGETIRVPVMEEDVEVSKRPRVKEEIEISKVARQDTKRISDTVRHEEVEVTGDTDSR